MLMHSPQVKETSHRATAFYCRCARQDSFLKGRQDKMIALWCRHKPIVNPHPRKQNSISEFYYYAGIQPNPCTCGSILPWLDIVREPHRSFITEGREKNLQSPAHINLWGLAFSNKQKKQSPLPIVPLISHVMMTLITPCILPSSTTT